MIRYNSIFPRNIKCQHNFFKLNKCVAIKLAKFEKWLRRIFCFSIQNISQNVVDRENVRPLMLYLKVGFIIFWCRTFGDLEWGLLLQFHKCCKTLKMIPRLYLIPTTRKMPTTFCKCHFTMNTNSLEKKVCWVGLETPLLDVRKTKSVDATEQKMLCISNMSLKEFV